MIQEAELEHIAIFGGTFDPVHNGHLFVAEEICSKFQIDRLFFVPANVSPFKTQQRTTPARLRCEMLKRAVSGLQNKKMAVSEYEVLNQGISYSVDTVRHFHELFPDGKLYFIIGADHAATFDQWKDYQTLIELCDIIIIARKGFRIKEIQKLVPMEKLHVVYSDTPDLSSSQIRQMLSRGESVSELIPKEAVTYIKTHQLYLPAEPPEQILKKLAGYISEKRLSHTIETAQEAGRLAEHFGADRDKAFLAGILHDCAKSLENAPKALEQYGVSLSNMDLACPSVIHQILGEAVAYYDFHIYDNEILHAIRYHTTGCPNMPLLTKIIFVADCCEPGRDYPGVDEIRKYAYTDLDRAVLISIENTVSYLLRQKKPIHTDTVLTYNDFVLKENVNGERTVAKDHCNHAG